MLKPIPISPDALQPGQVIIYATNTGANILQITNSHHGALEGLFGVEQQRGLIHTSFVVERCIALLSSFKEALQFMKEMNT